MRVRESIAHGQSALNEAHGSACGLALASGLALFSACADGNSCFLDADLKSKLARQEWYIRASKHA